MSGGTLETDYLVIGSGAAGMAFADSLITESEADVIMVDRRATPGGHWNDSYPFVRLHQPSRYYGVNSMPIGNDDRQSSGPEAGWYERASGADICAYFGAVMQRLVASGRVRFFPQCDCAGEQRFVSRVSGETFDVTVKKRVVDASYLGPAIPATTAPPFEVAAGARVIPVNQLPSLVAGPAERFVVIGAGKTAMDACVWLLGNGVEPGRIQWIKPRDAWLFNRRDVQPGELVGSLFEGIALQTEAAALATSIDDFFDRLEAIGQMLRVDPHQRPTMYRFAIVGTWEVELLRRITDVVRLGRVRRIDPDRITLEHGTVPTGPGSLHIHCAADGLRSRPPLPMFSPGRITLQTMRIGLAPFAAALVAFVEAHRDVDAEKNRLCPANVYPYEPLDLARATLVQMRADRAWSMEPDIAAWLDRSRLNPLHGLRARMADPQVQRAAQRYAQNAGAAVARLTQLTTPSQ